MTLMTEEIDRISRVTDMEIRCKGKKISCQTCHQSKRALVSKIYLYKMKSHGLRENIFLLSETFLGEFQRLS